MSTMALKLVREQVKAKLDERKARQGERDVRQAELDAIVSKADAEKRDLSDAETKQFSEVRTAVQSIDKDLAILDEDLSGLTQREQLITDAEKAKDASAAAAARWGSVDARSAETGAGDRNVSVKSEARTYNKSSEARGVSFFNDLYAQTMYRDNDAGERLARHQQEARVHELAGYERRDLTTAAFAGLTVPQYLTDLAAPIARAMKPTVDICNRHPLPSDGMTVNISRITTGTAAAAQATENAAVQETDADDTLLTVNVRTYAGQQDLSRQALERGTGTDDIVIQDLTRAYWTKVDADILNADGTSGTHLGIRSTSGIVANTYTDASPTGAEAYRTLPELISGIQSGVFMGVTHFIMHPRRFWWLTASIGTSFPLLHVDGVSTNQAGNISGTEYMAQGRNILGVPVVVDGNMATNIGAGTEDVIIAVTAPELHFWDDGVQFVRAEQTAAGNLTVKFVLYGYSAFTAGRYPGAHGLVSGTGLIAPVFTTA